MRKGEWGLVADIGATNARFALVDGDGGMHSARAYKIVAHPSLADAIARFLNDEGGVKPVHAALAIAAPISGDDVRMTNHPAWSFSTEALRVALQLETLRIINDFTANAYALPFLQEPDLTQIGCGQRKEGAPTAILGPGSGLGVSALIPCPVGATAITGEGGHATIAAATLQEATVLASLRAEYGHVSAERLLSGPGLVNIYKVLCGPSGMSAANLDPAQVTQAGMQGKDQIARQALDMFCSMLGSFAGDLALIFGARGGVFVAGGIAPKLGDYLVRSKFRTAFEAKGRFKAYLSEIPTFVITHDSPALLGAASLL
jgi:glucokinase